MSTPLQRRTAVVPSLTPSSQASSADRRVPSSGNSGGSSIFCSLGTLKVVVIVFLIGYNAIWSGLSLVFIVEPTIAEVNIRAADTPNLPIHTSLPGSASSTSPALPLREEVSREEVTALPEATLRSTIRAFLQPQKADASKPLLPVVAPLQSAANPHQGGQTFAGMFKLANSSRSLIRGAWLVDPSLNFPPLPVLPPRGKIVAAADDGLKHASDSTTSSSTTNNEVHSSSNRPQSAPRPNILFIMSDDHSAEAVSYRPKGRLAAFANLKHLDALARDGAVVEDMFVSLSLCSPSRASILTGVHAHVHGVYQLSGEIVGSRRDTTYVNVLKRHGYATALVGKWHLEHKPSGFDTFAVFVKQGSYKNPSLVRDTQAWSQKKSGVSKSQGHCSEVVTDIALGILDKWQARGIGAELSLVSSPSSKENYSTAADPLLQKEARSEAADVPLEAEPNDSQSSTAPVTSKKERQPFLLHVHYKETHEPWAFPPSYNASLDAIWEKARERMRKQISSSSNQRSSSSSSLSSSSSSSSSLLPPQRERASQLADPTWAFPEAPSMFEALKGQAGPIGGVPAGWPLETLGARIVEMQARGDFFGASELDTIRFSKFLNASNFAAARRLVHSKLVADYLRTAKAMDDSIGRLLEKIEAMGAARDTVVVYTSDQGYFLGERNGFDKRYMWDESIRAPCVVRYPRRIAPNTQLPSGFLLQHVDWAPTLLELAHVNVRTMPRLLSSSKTGIQPPLRSKPAMPYASTAPLNPIMEREGTEEPSSHGPTVGFHGRSFAHLLLAEGQQLPTLMSSSNAQPVNERWARDAIYYRFYGDPNKPLARPGHVGIRTRDGYKLILYYDLRCYPEKWQSSKTTAAVARPSHLSSDKVPPAGPWELFDLTNDPQERVNAFDQLRNTQSSLVAALMRLLAVEIVREGFEPGIIPFRGMTTKTTTRIPLSSSSQEYELDSSSSSLESSPRMKSEGRAATKKAVAIGRESVRRNGLEVQRLEAQVQEFVAQHDPSRLPRLPRRIKQAYNDAEGPVVGLQNLLTSLRKSIGVSEISSDSSSDGPITPDGGSSRSDSSSGSSGSSDSASSTSSDHPSLIQTGQRRKLLELAQTPLLESSDRRHTPDKTPVQAPAPPSISSLWRPARKAEHWFGSQAADNLLQQSNQAKKSSSRPHKVNPADLGLPQTCLLLDFETSEFMQCLMPSGISEAWSLREDLSKRLRSFHNRCTRSMCRVNLHHTFRHHITTSSLFRRLILLDIESDYHNRLLRWAGHVARMLMSRAPQQLLASWEAYSRPAGCTQMTWGRTLENAIVSKGISKEFKEWVTIAKDRPKWRQQTNSKPKPLMPDA